MIHFLIKYYSIQILYQDFFTATTTTANAAPAVRNLIQKQILIAKNGQKKIILMKMMH